jgi:hypothetical protein
VLLLSVSELRNGGWVFSTQRGRSLFKYITEGLKKISG